MKKILLRFLLALGVFILIVVVNLVIFNLTASRITEGTPITKTGSGHTALLVIVIWVWRSLSQNKLSLYHG